MKAKLDDLRNGILNKDKEIDIMNKQIGIIEMRFDECIIELEKKNESIEKELMTINY